MMIYMMYILMNVKYKLIYISIHIMIYISLHIMMYIMIYISQHSIM